MLQKIYCFVLVILSMTGCKVVAPEYTTVEKIIVLKQGISPAEVQNKLGILPYNIYHVQFGYSSVYLYKYKYQERKVRTLKLYRREGLTGGPERFTKAANLYVCFNNEKLATLFTDEGYKNGKHIILFENTVKVMNENPSDFIDPPPGSKSFRKLRRDKKQSD